MTPDGPERPVPLRRRPPLWTLAGAALALLTVGAVCAWLWRGRPAPPSPPAASPPSPDPRLTYAGPYLNVRPDVGYVGDDRCAECHEEIARSYRRHPMANSLTPIASLAPRQSYGADRHNPFEAFQSCFLVERVGDGVRHRQTRLGDGRKPIYESEMDVHYAVGSGVHGYSYLSDRDGFVFQTPISWFGQKKVWDLSPRFSPEMLTGRPIPADCLFCHANRTRPVAGTFNRYEEPLFDGYGIGCERCHGPGELHARNPGQETAGAADPTIVNPARLTPALRESVCNQCHFEGTARVVRRGRDPYDYRPGLPLGEVLAVFVKKTAAGADRRAVNHVEQMEQSGCFRGGTKDDRIGCTSCHDPHVFVGPDERAGVYRAACLKCHGRKQSECSVPVAERRRTSPDDSCVQCHMPPYSSSDVAHTASTDHRIPRRPAAGAADAPEGGAGAPLELLHFDGRGPQEADYRRDLALAVMEQGLKGGGGPLPKEAGAEAAALFEGAAHDLPDDVPLLTAKGQLAMLRNQTAEARAAFEAALARAPEWETALAGAALTADSLGDKDAALDYWRRAAAVDPYSAMARKGAGGLLADRRLWEEALPHARQWARLEPDKPEARKLFIRCLLKTGDGDAAQAELRVLKALQPGWERDLDHWYKLQQR